MKTRTSRARGRFFLFSRTQSKIYHVGVYCCLGRLPDSISSSKWFIMSIMVLRALTLSRVARKGRKVGSTENKLVLSQFTGNKNYQDNQNTGTYVYLLHGCNLK